MRDKTSPEASTLQIYGHDDFQLIRREACFEGFFQLDRFILKYRRFDGSWSSEIEREIFMRGQAVCVVPYDPVEDKVVLVEQFRPGAVLEKETPWLLELVAGMIEENESPVEVAHRESEEEAGLTLGEIEKICEYLVSPGGTTEKVYLYCSKVQSNSVGGIYGLAEENEDIKVHVLDLSDCMSLIESGEINNGSAIIGLQWLWMNRKRLQDKWA